MAPVEAGVKAGGGLIQAGFIRKKSVVLGENILFLGKIEMIAQKSSHLAPEAPDESAGPPVPCRQVV